MVASLDSRAYWALVAVTTDTLLGVLTPWMVALPEEPEPLGVVDELLLPPPPPQALSARTRARERAVRLI